jgi:hypothetical protein
MQQWPRRFTSNSRTYLLRRQQRLLRKGQEGPLATAEHQELAELRAAADRFVTRRSYALALLKWHGHTIPRDT